MSTVLITGSAGLIGSEAVHFFAQLGFNIVGIDNDMRSFFFGQAASTLWNRNLLKDKYGARYHHYDLDIREQESIENIFKEYSSDLDLIIHTAAQPSHDWAANDPHTDFTVNANGTLVLLEATRQYSPNAVLYSPRLTKFTEIHPTTCLSKNLKLGGKLLLTIGMRLALMSQ